MGIRQSQSFNDSEMELLALIFETINRQSASRGASFVALDKTIMQHPALPNLARKFISMARKAADRNRMETRNV